MRENWQNRTMCRGRGTLCRRRKWHWNDDGSSTSTSSNRGLHQFSPRVWIKKNINPSFSSTGLRGGGRLRSYHSLIPWKRSPNFRYSAYLTEIWGLFFFHSVPHTLFGKDAYIHSGWFHACQTRGSFGDIKLGTSP